MPKIPSIDIQRRLENTILPLMPFLRRILWEEQSENRRENWLRSTAAIYDESKTVTVMYDRNESARVKTENRINILSKQTHLWAICGLWTAVVIAGVQSRSDLEQC